ncbi:hypothetical protein V6N11_077208 [Hibiscus sabdariffa]|uniref:Uncharacterized protein n=1 Tax=Hibiscus sabdariffa TaxID=183260 RepID=A0ABR2TCI2_9ROSI
MGGRPPDPDMNVGQLQVFERLASPVGKNMAAKLISMGTTDGVNNESNAWKPSKGSYASVAAEKKFCRGAG